MGVNEKILEAIGIYTDNIVKKAGYNKTIQAQIISCQDATIGKYKCRYQDAIFYAYNTNTEVSYINGANVYVLIPSNDMGKEKIILGATKKLGINYISQASDDEAYELVGQNCINNNNIYYLDTNYIKYGYDIYNYERDQKNGIIDTATLEYNLKHSTSMLVGATIKTNIATNKQRNGHYGIAYTLRFYDNVYKEQTTRTYILDEDSMISNPYKLVLNTRQYQVFHIDGENFIRIDAITIFNSDFPEANLNQPEQKPINSGDIILSKFELYGANALSEQQINGIAITFYTPQGIFFTNADGDTQKIITAQVRIKGKLASSAQNIPFFWGRENVRIGPKDERYNKYLGRGWECLNQYTGQEWVPGNDTFILLRDEAPARNNRLKVAIVYNDNVITKQINIQNQAEDAITINIQSDGGTQFHHDIGHPNLTCLLTKNNEIIENDNYSYYWSYYSTSEGNQQMPAADYITINKKYQADLENLDDLRSKELTEKYKTDLQNAEQAVQAYDYIQRVKGNKIYNVQIRKIVNFKTFKCSVYNGNQFLGTGEITLTNKLQSQDLYSLVINNGSVVYQYNENGVAPNNKKLQNPQIIPALTFNLYDDNGKLVDSESLIRSKECQVTWIFPKKDTLLVKVPIEIRTSDEQQQQPSLDDSNDDFCYYRNILNLPYNIATNYNINKQNNQIILNVKYKGKDVTARTNFTFTKQGQPGTNGTEYIVKIVPNTMMNNPPLYPMITYYSKDQTYYMNYNIGTDDSGGKINYNSQGVFPFQVQLWRNGEKVNIDSNYVVEWEILKNGNQESNFQINKDENNIFTFKIIKPFNIEKAYSNIIKCSITLKNEGKTYYGTLPIITATVLNKDYQVQLKENSGFRYVLYSSDGVFPQYDSVNPFEIICKQKIGNFWEDISNISKEGEAAEYSLSYDFGTANDLLIATNKETETLNQKWYKPIEEFNGYATDAAVTCIARRDRAIIASIHIPVHFLLNRYGLAHLNDWDGNSIQINEDGGYILAPQMGAGTKDEHNTFTGVLMGEIIQPSKNNYNNGLMGFYNGQRSFFLDSETGGAFFGPKGTGQIIIDPKQQEGLIYSYNFFDEKNYNVKGYPNNYNYKENSSIIRKDNNGIGQGMIINLSEPQIYFGSGSFYVTKDGHIHAGGGGDIAGWKINDTQIYTENERKEPVLTLESTTTIKWKKLENSFKIAPKPTAKKPSGRQVTQEPVRQQGESDDAFKARMDIFNQWKEYRKLDTQYRNDMTNFIKAIQTEIDGIFGAGAHKTVHVWLKTNQKKNKEYIYYDIGVLGSNLNIKDTDNWKIGEPLSSEVIKGLQKNPTRGYEHMNYSGSIRYRPIEQKILDELIANKSYYISALKQYILYVQLENPIHSRGKIYSNLHKSLNDSTNGFYLSDDGLSMGSQVLIESDGVVRLGAGAVAKTENGRYWIINQRTAGDETNTAISYGNKGDYGSVYLGTDSISLGSKFSVTNSGYLIAALGTVGGWDIDSSTIKSKDSNNLILHNTGWIEGNGWRINNSGFYSGSDTNGQGFNNSGFKLNGSSLTSPGGIINSSGSGCLGGTSLNTSPLTWTPKSVTLRGSTEIINGAKIGGFEITDNNISAGSNANNATIIRPTSIQTNDLTINSHIYVNRPSGLGGGGTVYGRTGTITFSDQSKMYFSDGILVGVSKGTDSETSWNGD